VLTRRVEKLVPLRRLTCIIMPHRGPRASLRLGKGKEQGTLVNGNVEGTQVDVSATKATDLRKMSAIQILKSGPDGNSWKKKGWLFDVLKRDGLSDGSKQSRKELCWSYYKSQLLYIEALQEAREDSEYDPRRNDHKTGKDGRFISKKGTDKPKNPLTVTYLCFAFDVPYATFKRWKCDAFVSKKYEPAHKGKSVLTDTTWASQVFNAQHMFVKHSMAVWLDKHPAKKHDAVAKKVCNTLTMSMKK
jgi:hypothetical protein